MMDIIIHSKLHLSQKPDVVIDNESDNLHGLLMNKKNDAFTKENWLIPSNWQSILSYAS